MEMKASNEIRLNTFIAAGRMVGAPIPLVDDEVHFRFEADVEQAPYHCYCNGVTAQNLLKYCQAGDEFHLRGQLHWKHFSGEAEPRLLVYARWTSYGRKLRTLR